MNRNEFQLRRNCGALFGLALIVINACVLFGISTSVVVAANDTSVQPLPARIVAVGVPGAAAVAPVGTFHPGGPIHDNPQFRTATESQAILDPNRILVSATSNFGAPHGAPEQPLGAILSIDPRAGGVLTIPPTFARRGDQARTLDGRVMLFTTNSTAFLNAVHNKHAITARFPPVAVPTGISLNNAFGRIWITSATSGPTGIGLHSVLDPDGSPLDKAPNKLAGGVFAGALTDRQPQMRMGSMTTAATATALLGKSPDGSGRAVFAGLHADGSIVQVHVEAGVDGLAPAGTITAVKPAAASYRHGMLLNWVPDMVLYISDCDDNSVIALTLRPNGKIFEIQNKRRLTSNVFNFPIDLSPAVPEIGSSLFSSNTTLAGGSDFYIANRGNDTVVRLRQDGSVVATRKIAVERATLNGGHLNGVAVSPDANRIWLTLTGTLDGYPDGAVIEVPAFGATAAPND